MKIELHGHYDYKRLLVSSLPSMAMMIIGSLYSIVDGLFVSNYVGITPFAGLNIAWPAIMVIGAMGLMVGTGGSAIVSRMLGQRDLDRACRTFTSLVAFTVILAVGFGIPMFLLMPKTDIQCRAVRARLCCRYASVHAADGISAVLHGGGEAGIGHQTVHCLRTD